MYLFKAIFVYVRAMFTTEEIKNIIAKFWLVFFVFFVFFCFFFLKEVSYGHKG